MVREGKAGEEELELLSEGANAARETFRGVLDLKNAAKKKEVVINPSETTR